MKKVIVMGLAAFASTSAFAQIYTATQFWHSRFGSPGQSGSSAYSNLTNNTGGGWAHNSWGGANGVTSTRMTIDDETVSTAYGGAPVVGFKFSAYTVNTTTASPTVSFWADDNGAPGQLLGSFRFAPIKLDEYELEIWSYSSVSPLFFVPSSGKMWQGESWDNFADIANTGATGRALANINQLLFNPPTHGTSENHIFLCDDFGSNLVDRPAGTLQDFGQGNPNATFANEIIVSQFVTVPEPGSFAVIGLGLAGLLVRRKKATR